MVHRLLQKRHVCHPQRLGISCADHCKVLCFDKTLAEPVGPGPFVVRAENIFGMRDMDEVDSYFFSWVLFHAPGLPCIDASMGML